MASLTAIRRAICTTIEENIEGEIFTYQGVPDVTQLPAVVVEPANDPNTLSGDYNGAFGRGLDTWNFNLYVLVSRTDTITSQEVLDQYLTGAGPKSIREAIYKNATLGFDDGTDAGVRSCAGYGGSFENARVPHVGAILKCTVLTDGSTV